MPRLTIERTIWSKVQTQLQKADNIVLKQGLAAIKITFSPAQAAILWDPSKELMERLRDLLVKERTFIRKPESAGFKLMSEVIARIDTRLLIE